MHSGHVRVDYKKWWEEIMGNNPSPGTTAFPFLPSNSSYPFPDGDPSIPITPIIPTQVTTPGPATSATIKIGEVELILEGFFSGVGGCFFIALMVFGIILIQRRRSGAQAPLGQSSTVARPSLTGSPDLQAPAPQVGNSSPGGVPADNSASPPHQRPTVPKPPPSVSRTTENRGDLANVQTPLKERLYDELRSPPIRVQPPPTNIMENAIPLKTFKTNETSPVINNPVSKAGEFVLIDLGSDNAEKSKAKEPTDSGLGEDPASLNNTMIFRGNNDPSASLVTSSLRPSAPSPSFTSTPPFSSTLNPFLSINKIPRSPDGSEFQGYSTLQGTPEQLVRLREYLQDSQEIQDYVRPLITEEADARQSTPFDPRMRSRLPRRSAQRFQSLNEVELGRKK